MEETKFSIKLNMNWTVRSNFQIRFLSTFVNMLKIYNNDKWFGLWEIINFKKKNIENVKLGKYILLSMY